MQSLDRDEIRASQAATVIMVLATAYTLATRILGVEAFTDIFDVFIVYLPTAILVGILVFQRVRGSSESGSSTGDQSVPGNMAA